MGGVPIIYEVSNYIAGMRGMWSVTTQNSTLGSRSHTQNTMTSAFSKNPSSWLLSKTSCYLATEPSVSLAICITEVK